MACASLIAAIAACVRCRRNVFPRLLPEAAEVLQRFYISLRREHGDDDAAPITTRQLESLIRLSQARAKMELRQVRLCGGNDVHGACVIHDDAGASCRK